MALAQEPCGHHRGRGLKDGAATPFARHLGRLSVPEVGVDRYLVPTQGVEEVFLQVGIFKLAPFAGSLVMVHDRLRIKFAQHVQEVNAPKNSLERSSAPTSASTSSRHSCSRMLSISSPAR